MQGAKISDKELARWIKEVRDKTSMRNGPEGIAEAPEKKSAHQHPPPGDQHSSQSHDSDEASRSD